MESSQVLEAAILDLINIFQIKVYLLCVYVCTCIVVPFDDSCLTTFTTSSCVWNHFPLYNKILNRGGVNEEGRQKGVGREREGERERVELVESRKMLCVCICCL